MHRPRKIVRIPRLDELEATSRTKDQSENKEAPLEMYGEKSFTPDDLKGAWDAFAAAKKEKGKDMEYAVLMQNYYLKENHNIVLQLTNSVKINILDRFRAELITSLKEKLDNKHIQIETELLEEEKAYRPYTNKEKFEYLAEKRPILRDLKARLGLDPDL